MGSHKMVGTGYVFTKNSQIISISAMRTTTCHTKQLDPLPNSSATHVVIHGLLSACQGKMGPFKGHLSTRGHHTGLRKRPE